MIRGTDNKNNLLSCFERVGVPRSDWDKKCITYAVAEQALLLYRSSNNLSLSDMELILRQVRDYMQVGGVSRQASETQYLVH